MGLAPANEQSCGSAFTGWGRGHWAAARALGLGLLQRIIKLAPLDVAQILVGARAVLILDLVPRSFADAGHYLDDHAAVPSIGSGAVVATPKDLNVSPNVRRVVPVV